MRWCTVTVTDQDGRRHSVDVQTTSTFDTAHLFVVEAKKETSGRTPEAHACDSFRGCRRRQSVSRDRNSASDLDCGKAWDLERAEGISVLQKARTGIMGKRRRTKLSFARSPSERWNPENMEWRRVCNRSFLRRSPEWTVTPRSF